MPVRRKSQPVEVEEEQVDWAPKIEERRGIASLREALESIKSRDGIVGYIIRGSTSASVDVKDPSKIIEYAGLSAEMLETADSLSTSFGLGKISSIVLVGKSLKVVSLSKGEQQVSIFMEKAVDHEAILRELEYY